MKKRNKKIISWIIRGISALLLFSVPVIKIGYYPLIAFLAGGLFIVASLFFDNLVAEDNEQ